MISKRLLSIVNKAKGFNSLADVGSDHGYLGIYAAKELGFKEVLLTDINPDPINQAKKNIASFDVSHKVTAVLGDGLKPINKEYDVLVISGMGGNLISSILTDDITKAKSFKRLVLSPNKDSYILRKMLMDNDFKIIDEDLVLDYKHYEIIVATPNIKESYTELELKYGPFLIKNKSDVFLNFYHKKLEFFKEELANATSLKAVNELKNKIAEIEQIL